MDALARVFAPAGQPAALAASAPPLRGSPPVKAKLRPSQVPVPVLQRECAACAEGRPCEGQQEKVLQAAGRPSAVPVSREAASAVLAVVGRQGGQPLDERTRGEMEARLGGDFSAVRIHTGESAVRSAAAVQAKGYTVGNDIVFGPGQFAPESPAGRQTLAHELVHVQQQRQGPVAGADKGAGIAVSDPGDHFERDATATAAQALAAPLAAAPGPGASERAPAASRSASPAVQRDTGPGAPGPPAAAPGTQWEACGAAGECPPREPGELERARAAGLRLGALDEAEEIVYGFPAGSANVSRLSADPAWVSWSATLAGGTSRFEILGFSDCQGGAELNADVRKMRATNVSNALPASARANIDGVAAAPLTDCVASNDTEANRSYNRSAVFRPTLKTLSFQPEVLAVRQCPPISPASAASLDDYGSLVRCAEKQTGLGPREMLALLRQLYYGKSWSVSKSSQWDNVIPCSPDIGNPESRLGANLFHALRGKDEIEGVDVGHIWTGLESMTCPAGSVTLFRGLVEVDMPNEAFATWGGDLGSAVAAFVACPQLGTDAASFGDCGKVAGAQPLSFYLVRAANNEDLEGDIDAFVIRAASRGIPCTGSARKAFSPTKPMSEVLLEYFGGPGTVLGDAHDNRYRCFAEAIGGQVAGNRITNRYAIRDPLRHRVASFADIYYTKIRGFPHTTDSGERTTLLEQSGLAVDWFFDWLESGF